MKKQRKHYTPDEKVAILRRHLVDNGDIQYGETFAAKRIGILFSGPFV
jgi:hypothetical protein